MSEEKRSGNSRRGTAKRTEPSEWLRVHRIVQGSGDDFRSLVIEYHPLAYSLAYKVLDDREDAEEIVQDAFVKVHDALDRFRGEASLKTWILRIVMRLSLNRRRDRSRSAWHRLGLNRRGEEEPDEAPEAISVADLRNPEAECISDETRRLVLGLLDELPETLRETLILNSLEELSYDEIARVLNVPLGTVSSRIHSAREKLSRKLAERDLL